MTENTTESDGARPRGEEKQSEYPKSDRRPLEKERKVWVEVYPGGDCQIELGHMDGEDLYLQGNESAALRELLNELLPEGDDGE